MLKELQASDSEYWTSRTIPYDSGASFSNLSTIELDAFISDYISRLRTTQVGTHKQDPKLMKPFCSILPQANKEVDDSVSLLYGIFECSSQCYFLFSLELHVARRSIKVKKCSRIGGQMNNNSRWRQFLQEPADSLFRKAFKASWGSHISDDIVDKTVKHACEKGCLSNRGRFPAPQLLSTFSGISVSEIRLTANKIRLVMQEGELVQDSAMEM